MAWTLPCRLFKDYALSDLFLPFSSLQPVLHSFFNSSFEHISTSLNLGFLSANTKHVDFLCPIERLSVIRQGREGSFSIAKLHMGYFQPKELADVFGKSWDHRSLSWWVSLPFSLGIDLVVHKGPREYLSDNWKATVSPFLNIVFTIQTKGFESHSRTLFI